MHCTHFTFGINLHALCQNQSSNFLHERLKTTNLSKFLVYHKPVPFFQNKYFRPGLVDLIQPEFMKISQPPFLDPD